MNDKRQMKSSGHPTQMTERIALLLSTRGSFFSRGAIDSWMNKSCLSNQDRHLPSVVTLVQDERMENPFYGHRPAEERNLHGELRVLKLL